MTYSVIDLQSAPRTNPFIIFFHRIHPGDLLLVGGKGLSLGRMTRAGIPVPPGFCVTTAAFTRFIGRGPAEEIYGKLEALDVQDLGRAHAVGKEIREGLSRVEMPAEVEEAVTAAWRELGEGGAYAVRSSATAEDLPEASFAGQQDTFLNVRGREELLEKVKACWISLFTARAIVYRSQNHFSHRSVLLSVVIQRMVLSEVSGILFTADPLTGNRNVVSIDAGFGLGEALVSGKVSADAYKVQKRTMEILEKKIGGKKTAVWPRLGGGTLEEELEENRRGAQALSDEKILELVRLGRKVEDYYEKPQDIEWALEKNKLYVIQSRPVTTLYPVPVSVLGKEGLRVYASINHVQVMTEPFSPLGASVLRTMIPFGKGGDPEKESPYCVEAGGRLYTDVTEALRFKRIGRFLIGFAMRVDRLIAGALREIAGRREFQAFPGLEARRALSRAFFSFFLPVVFRIFLNFWVLEPERAEAGFRREIDRRLRRVQERLRSAPQGPGRVRLIQEVLSGLPSFFREAVPRVAAGILSWNLLEKFAGREEKDSADVAAVVRGLRGNVTTEMDLELGDLADVARRYPAAARCLEQAQAGDILDLLKGVEGGEVFAGAFREFLRKYGMRGQGEVDIGRPRWRENPAMLVQAMRGNLASPEMGLHRKRHERLAKEAEEAGARLIQKAKRDSWGFVKAWMARRLIRVCRCYLALREHPKFYIVRVFGLIREALLEEGCALQERGVLENSRDVVYLTLNETAEALEGSAAVDFRRLVADRKNERKRWERLVPPRVITSDGEIVIPRREAKGLPEGSLAGTPASAGVAEGLARVIRDPSKEILRHGEILVAPFSDPAWTPLFLHAAGFVAEVGGLMTHGAVVAREYGIPAVVGVVDAVKLIRTGQRIRVHGDLGYVETLDAPSSL